MILSPAKLNISLNVNSLLDNGYHSISSYVFFLDLFDKLYIEKSSFNSVIVSGLFKDDLINNGGDTIINKSISFCKSHFKIHFICLTYFSFLVDYSNQFYIFVCSDLC